MINIKKEINLNSSLINKNNELKITLSSPCFDKANINNSLCLNQHNEIKVSNNDVISANILIRNTENIPLDDLKFKICNTDIFKFIPSSLKNKRTKELYICESTKDNIFSLGSLDSNDNINIEFCMRAHLNNLTLSTNSSIKLLSLKNDNLENEKLDLVKIDRNELQISANPNKNLIELINIGSKPLKI